MSRCSEGALSNSFSESKDCQGLLFICPYKFKEFISFQVVDLVKYCKNADEDEVNERLNLINDLSPDDRRTLEKLVKEEKEKRTPRRRTPRLSNRARLLSG